MEQASTRLALLEQVRLHAEKMVYQRAEREIRLQAEIEALRRTEAAQLKRIEEAEAETRRMTEEETRSRATEEACRIAEAKARQRAAEALELAEGEARQLAETEEQGIERLETIRRKAEASSYERAEKERLLTSQLLALGEAAAEQVKRIQRVEADLHEAEEKAIQFEEAARQKSEDVAIAEIEAHRREPLANDFPMMTSNAETAAAWDVPQFSERADVSSEEGVQLVSNNGFASSLAQPLETYEQSSIENFGERLAPAQSEEDLQPESAERSIVSSLVERIRNGGPAERAKALQEVARLNDNDAFSLITSFFDDSSAKVRNAAARALYDLGPNRADTFARALGEASPTRGRQIALAMDGSGLAAEAIDNLAGESREKIDDAFSMLLLMAKAGEFKSLLQTIDTHPDDLVRLSVIKVLTFCNQPEIIPAFRSLAVRGTLPTEIRAALLASIYEISKNTRENSPSAA